MAKRLRCYVRSHRWVDNVQAGELYYECRYLRQIPRSCPDRVADPLVWDKKTK
jgi:hypothetical protein